MDERKGYVDSIDAMLEGTKQMRELYQNEFDEIEVIQTGFREVDRMLGGLRKRILSYWLQDLVWERLHWG